MTTPTAPLSWSQIQTEFGGANPISLSEYYRGGANVPTLTGASIQDGTAISTSGAIRAGMFRGQCELTIAANTSNYNIRTAAGSPAYAVTVILTINSGIYVFGTATNVYALDTGTGWVAGSRIIIVNNGIIAGRGGAGGASIAAANGVAGGAGGPGLRCQFATTVYNNGTVGGGGGGGGGSSAYFDGKSWFAGGGGGGGRVNGTGGTGTAAGGTGSLTAAGGGGSYGYVGGAGGGLGAAGAAGGSGYTTGGGGGAAGAYITGNSNVTWAVVGTRLGGVIA